MKRHDIPQIYGSESYPPEAIEDKDDWNADASSNHEKETFIKHIRQDLAAYRAYCPAEAMARAIGGEFTVSFILNICDDSEWPISHYKWHGKSYIAILPFLEKLQVGLSFEEL